jgi:hypothetical protein
MKLTAHSRNQLLTTFTHWQVPKDYADPMFNYLVHGFEPGSFFTAVLANDFARAVQHSHPSNTITALKGLVGWIQSAMPECAYGSYQNVKNWLEMPPHIRREELVKYDLVFTAEDEIMKVLEGQPTHEPILW